MEKDAKPITTEGTHAILNQQRILSPDNIKHLLDNTHIERNKMINREIRSINDKIKDHALSHDPDSSRSVKTLDFEFLVITERLTESERNLIESRFLGNGWQYFSFVLISASDQTDEELSVSGGQDFCKYKLTMLR